MRKVVDVPNKNQGIGESAYKKQSAINQSAAPARDPKISTRELSYRASVEFDWRTRRYDRRIGRRGAKSRRIDNKFPGSICFDR